MIRLQNVYHLRPVLRRRIIGRLCRLSITRPVAVLPLIHLVIKRFLEGLLLRRALRNDGQSTEASNIDTTMCFTSYAQNLIDL